MPIAESAARLCEANDALIFRIEGDRFKRFANYGPLPGQLGGGPPSTDRASVPVALWSIEKQFTFMIWQRYQRRICGRFLPDVSVSAPRLQRRCCEKVSRSGSFLIRRTGGPTLLGQTDCAAQNLRRPSGHRHRKRAACSKNSRSATQNCARRWSIRPQRPRCSASSAARRRTCSRSSTPSSRAPREFVGLMTWCCGSSDGDTMVPRAHFGSIPIGRVEISIDAPWIRWMREHGTLHVPDVREQNDAPMRRFINGLAHLLGCSPSSAGGTRWNAERASYRGAPLHPGADQAARNLRRPGGDRHRECTAVPRTQGIVGAADCDE